MRAGRFASLLRRRRFIILPMPCRGAKICGAGRRCAVPYPPTMVPEVDDVATICQRDDESDDAEARHGEHAYVVAAGHDADADLSKHLRCAVDLSTTPMRVSLVTEFQPFAGARAAHQAGSQWPPRPRFQQNSPSKFVLNKVQKRHCAVDDGFQQSIRRCESAISCGSAKVVRVMRKSPESLGISCVSPEIVEISLFRAVLPPQHRRRGDGAISRRLIKWRLLVTIIAAWTWHCHDGAFMPVACDSPLAHTSFSAGIAGAAGEAAAAPCRLMPARHLLEIDFDEISGRLTDSRSRHDIKCGKKFQSVVSHHTVSHGRAAATQLPA